MAQKYTLSIEPEAIEDIQQAIDYYNSVKSGLGKKFFLQVDNQFNSLRKNPKAFEFVIIQYAVYLLENSLI
jgi:hypothetical protein